MGKTHEDGTITEPVASEVNEVSEIEQLRARNAELEAENARFKKQIEKLTKEVTWRAKTLDELNKMTLEECLSHPFTD